MRMGDGDSLSGVRMHSPGIVARWQIHEGKIGSTCLCRVICASSEDDAEHVVIVCLRIFESLDNERPYAVSATVAVCGGVPCLASIVSFGKEMA